MGVLTFVEAGTDRMRPASYPSKAQINTLHWNEAPDEVDPVEIAYLGPPNVR